MESVWTTIAAKGREKHEMRPLAGGRLGIVGVAGVAEDGQGAAQEAEDDEDEHRTKYLLSPLQGSTILAPSEGTVQSPSNIHSPHGQHEYLGLILPSMGMVGLPE